MIVCQIGVYSIFTCSVEGRFVYVAQTEDETQHFSARELQPVVDWCVARTIEGARH